MKFHGPAIFLSMALTVSGAICFLNSPTVLHAQSTTSGDIAGVVTDATGAVVPNAKIVVTNNETGVTQSLVSSSNGGYRAPLLKPGTYRITVTATGFQSVSTIVTVAIGQITSGDTKLTVGTVDAAMKTANLSVEQRLQLKQELSRAGLMS